MESRKSRYGLVSLKKVKSAVHIVVEMYVVAVIIVFIIALSVAAMEIK